MAAQTRHPPDGLLHHSDRGSQYASQDYQPLLNPAGMICSMSRKGNGPEIRFHLRSVTIMQWWKASLLA